MGNCVPVQKSTDPAMKVKCSINSQGNSIGIGSSIKDNTDNGDHSMAELNSMPQSSTLIPDKASARELSNREEMFFDSEPWLDSDCEDFLSVNGDFTPSCGSTPIHLFSSNDPSQHNESLHSSSTANLVPEGSPTDMKKQLIELFRESFSSDAIDDNQNLHDKMEAKPITFYFPPKPTNRSPYESAANSICSSETTPQRRSNAGKEKPAHSAQCCLPNLVRSLSFSERKKRLSPAYNGGR